MAPETKTIVVIGATGNQGASVANVFLSLPHWHVRCAVRNPQSEKARALAAQGAEVVPANLDDQESLARAFDGAHAVFLLTDFWAPWFAALSAGINIDDARRTGFDTELRHARNAIAAAEGSPTLERLVYSALGPMAAASGGKYSHCLHWEAKNAVVEEIESEHSGLAARTSYVYPAAYATNAFAYPKRDDATGEYVLLIPGTRDMRFPVFDETSPSMGLFVRALIEDEAPRTRLLAYDEDITVGGLVDAWSRVTGKDARVESVSMADMRTRTGLPDEVLDGAGFLSEFHFMAGVEGFIEPHQLKTKIERPSYEDFLRTRTSEQLLECRFTAP